MSALTRLGYEKPRPMYSWRDVRRTARRARVAWTVGLTILILVCMAGVPALMLIFGVKP